MPGREARNDARLAAGSILMIQLILVGLALLLAGVGPLVFPLAESGHGSMAWLGSHLELPAVAGLLVLTVLSRRRWSWFSRDLLGGAAAGILATLALEVVRLLGYKLGYMPGNMPRLMGVLLLDRFALGPSITSDVVGWLAHLWNGASFGLMYVLLVGTRRPALAVGFAILVGLGFLVSPVVMAMGVGRFGLDFSIGFPATVLLAHVAFGAALGVLARRMAGSHGSRLRPVAGVP